MGIHEITEYLGIFGTVAQVFVSIGALICFYWTFKLQAFTFEEQQKITKAQIALYNIETLRHRKEIMPRFTMIYSREPYRQLSTPEGKSLLDLKFELNENEIKSFDMVIFENVGFRHYNGDRLPSGKMNSKGGFVLQFEFNSVDGTILKSHPQLHMIFKLHFFDIKGNEYEQITAFVPELEERSVFNLEPVLLKAIDIIQ